MTTSPSNKRPQDDVSNDWADKIRSQKYLSFVRSHGCLVCSRPSQAHHLTHIMEGIDPLEWVNEKWKEFNKK